jgi:hypothetical protein
MGPVKEDEIRAALHEFEPETLADMLVVLFSEGKTPKNAVAGTAKPELANFSQAIHFLKNNYDFPELDFFATEADLVYVKAGERRVLLTDRMNSQTGNEGGGFNGSRERETPSGINARETRKDDKDPFENETGRFSNLEI